MIRHLGKIGNVIRSLKHQPWPISTAVAPVVTGLTEEENTPYYDTKRFYPARLGEILQDRYQIATKLGYGTYSTVWLARDLSRWRWQPEHYVAIKINALSKDSDMQAENELNILEQIARSTTPGIGKQFLRTAHDKFILSGGHVCFVFEPLREPLWIVKKRFKGNVIPPDILRIMVEMILHGLDYLHRVCHITHADLKPDNVMMEFKDMKVLVESATDEVQNPAPQKLCADRVIYLSRNDYGQPSIASFSGILRIHDFGNSVSGSDIRHGPIQAESYRAPEVILDAGWRHSADIWSLGVMLWDLLEDRNLFYPFDIPNREYDDATHLGLISALIGPPPSDLLLKGRRTHLFYDFRGNFEPSYSYEASKDFNFGNSVRNLESPEKELFLDFVGQMLRWRPEERSTAKMLLSHPWLTYGR